MKRSVSLLYMACLLIAPAACADIITIHNESDIPVYGATYQTGTESVQIGAAQTIAPHSQANFDRPPFRFDTSGRRFVFSPRKEDITVSISEDAMRNLESQDIGNPLNNNFYIDVVKGKLESFNALNWRFYQPIKNNIITPARASLAALTTDRLKNAYLISPYDTMPASMRMGRDLCPQEIKYRIARAKKARTAIERFAQKGIGSGKQPVIALCCSGGGERSALATAGALSGFEKSGLMDGIMYIATLSGSTWTLGSMMSLNMNAVSFKQTMIEKAQRGLFNPEFTLMNLKDALLKKFFLGRPLSLVDVYGKALGSIFLHTNGAPTDAIFLSSQATRVAKADVPYPIYTAMLTKKPYEWVEFTPDEIGCNYLGGYVPSWAFGREFINGASQENTPPESLEFMYGIFGFAIGLNFNEMVQLAKEKVPSFLFTIMTTATGETPIGRQRVFPAQVLNYTYGTMPLPRSSQNMLTLVDLGIFSNLPLQPLLERHEREIDIIIILDNSDYTADPIGTELKKVITHLSRRNILLPEIDFSQLGASPCTVIKDPKNPKAPVIIYMPLIKNPAFSATFDPTECMETFCSTFNFSYTKEEAQSVADLAEYNAISSKQKIVKAIQDVIEKNKSADTGAKGNRKDRVALRRDKRKARAQLV